MTVAISSKLNTPNGVRRKVWVLLLCTVYRRLLICNCYVAFSNPKLFVQKLHDMINDKSLVWRTYANVLKINTKYFNLTMKVIIQWKGEKGEQRHIYGREMEGKEDQEKGLRGREREINKGQKALVRPHLTHLLE